MGFKEFISEKQKPMVSGVGNKWEVLDGNGKTVKTFPKDSLDSAQAYLKKNFEKLK